MTITMGRNIASLRAERQIGLSSQALSQSFERLSSGQRINRPSDDPAGRSVAAGLSSHSRVYTQALRNVNDGVSALSIADAALGELGGVLGRMSELAEQAANGSLSRIQRLSLDGEAESLRQEFNRILETTKFNGRTLLNLVEGELSVQAGFGVDGAIRFSIGNQLARKIGVGFEEEVSHTAASGNISSFAVGDVNGDGIPDMVTSSSVGGDIGVSFGNGDGTFQTAVDYAASGPSAFALGDIDGDGDLDIVAGGTTNTYSLLNNGDGTFGAATSLGIGTSSDVKLGDVTGDGILDVITYSGTSLRISTGNGAGGISGTTTIVAAGNGASLGLIDADGDGDLDIATTDNSFTGLQIRLNDGTGSFGSAVQTSAVSNGRLTIGDFNYDGLADIAIDGSSFTTNILQSNGDGTFAISDTLTRGSAVVGLDVGDVDGDGILDLVWRETATTFSVYKGNGDGTFEDGDPTTLGLLSTGNRIIVADLNGDGVEDIVLKSTTSSDVLTLLASTIDSTSLQRYNLTTQADAQGTLELLTSARNRVAAERGVVGAALSRSGSALSLLSAFTENFKAAESRIVDADIAAETATLVRNQILQQSGAAILAQANQAASLVLTLLREPNA